MTPEEPLMVAINSRMGFHPDEISRRSFPTARKGYDQEAVRQYLQSLGNEVQEMLDREQALRRQVADAERRAAEPELDEATLMRAVGIETAKILQAAHDAAQDVISRAEQKASEILGSAESILTERQEAAEAEASAVLEASRTEAEAVSESARQEAVALLQATKAECRRIVREARALRAETLGDLAEKRRGLRVQLEELRAGRDFLIEVVETVGSAASELREKVANAEHDARVAAAAAGELAEEALDDSDLQAVADSEEGLLAEGALGEEEEDEAEFAAAAAGEAAAEPYLSESAPLYDAAGAFEEEAASYEETTSEEAAVAADHATSRRSVDELFARIRAGREEEESFEEFATEPEESDREAIESLEVDVTAPVEALAPIATGGVDEGITVLGPIEEEGVLGSHSAHEAALEERDEEPPTALEEEEEEDALTAGVAEAVLAEEEASVPAATVEEDEDLEDGSEPLSGEDEEALARRSQLLGPVRNKLSRVLKRALQDDQNVLLDAIRHSSGAPDLDKLLPGEAQLARLEEATAGPLADAWSLGHRWIGEEEPEEATAVSAGQQVAAALAAEVSGLLRHRLAEALSGVSDVSDGAAEAAGASYREWRGKRVEQAAGDFATRSFAEGIVRGGEGSEVRWVVDDEGHPCPDCDDNALAGPVRLGEEFPTGQLHPPVHSGCRCLLVAATS